MTSAFFLFFLPSLQFLLARDNVFSFFFSVLYLLDLMIIFFSLFIPSFYYITQGLGLGEHEPCPASARQINANQLVGGATDPTLDQEYES